MAHPACLPHISSTICYIIASLPPPPTPPFSFSMLSLLQTHYYCLAFVCTVHVYCCTGNLVIFCFWFFCWLTLTFRVMHCSSFKSMNTLICSGGAELLFANVKKHSVTLPDCQKCKFTQLSSTWHGTLICCKACLCSNFCLPLGLSMRVVPSCCLFHWMWYSSWSQT